MVHGGRLMLVHYVHVSEQYERDERLPFVDVYCVSVADQVLCMYVCMLWLQLLQIEAIMTHSG